MAMAPEQLGIGIRRHFTEPGVHPYDTVEWERRDARIPNFKDGTDAFYQADVEFPSRGRRTPPTSSPRSTSGARSAPPSARARCARSSTASPTRSRRGASRTATSSTTREARGVPQRAEVHPRAPSAPRSTRRCGSTSACKGVPQQASACQPYDALVSTPEGLVPIGKLVEDNAVGAKVFDAHGLTADRRGEAQRSQAGAAHPHEGRHHARRHGRPPRLASSGTGSGRFVEAGDAALPATSSSGTAPSRGATGEISTREMAEAALAGWLQSDGFVGQYDGHESVAHDRGDDGHRRRARVGALGASTRSSATRIAHERTVVTQDETLDCRRLRLYGEHLRPFVERGGSSTRGVDMAVPAQLFEAPLPIVAAYLRSVFQAEGYVSQRERSCGRRPRHGLRGARAWRAAAAHALRHLLAGAAQGGPARRPPRLLVARRSSVAGDRRRFADEIGFVDERKADKLEASFDAPGSTPQRESSGSRSSASKSLGEMDVYDIQTESGEYLSDNLRVHNCFILAVDDTMDGDPQLVPRRGDHLQGRLGLGHQPLATSARRRSTSKGGGTASRSGELHARRRRVGRHDQVGRQDPPRRQDGHPRRRPPRRRGVHLVQGASRSARRARCATPASTWTSTASDSHSIQYQNANNSVRVTDEFMQAVVDDARLAPARRSPTGEPVKTMKARELMRQISQAAWECADPGMQFDTTINRWHTAPNTGRINAQQPVLASTCTSTTRRATSRASTC